MIYIEVTESIFRDQFNSIRPDNFSYEGITALFDYLTDMDQSEMIELDVIAICCEFSEYSNIEEFKENYGNEYQSFDDIEQVTTLINIDGTRFIVQDF